jgi:hypothetical protein
MWPKPEKKKAEPENPITELCFEIIQNTVLLYLANMIVVGVS